MERGPTLACVEGLLLGQSFPITAEGVRVGRDPGNEIRIDDAGVSRQHARILLHNGAIWVQDAGSRNGIFVNGDRVPDHRQVKVGDKVSVGGCTFLITMPEATPSRASIASMPAPAPTPPARPSKAGGWKIWPFVVAVLLALAIIVCFGLLGSREDPQAQAPAGGSYSLSAVIEPGAEAPGTAAAPSAAPAAPPSVAEALAVAAGADADAARAQLPEPPAGVSAQELVERAGGMMDAGRLNDARTQYRMALKLDPACAICTVRIAKLDAEIAGRAQQQFDAGMRYYDSMQLPQAIEAWETVLMLVPDATDPMHVRAVQSLERARAQGAGRK